jgi:tetratricopeptide (TPR) repeat protein
METNNQNEETEVKSQTSSPSSGNQFLSRIEDFFETNRKMVLYGAGGILLVVALYFGYKQLYLAPLEEEAELAIFNAERLFRNDSLDAALKGGPDFQGLQSIADEYGSTKAGNRASYMSGVVLLRQGNFDDAISYFEGYDLDDVMLTVFSKGGIGDAYSEKGEFEKAAEYYTAAANADKNVFTTPYFLKKSGLVYEELKQYDKALKAYETIKYDFEKAPESTDIDKYIGRVKGLLGSASE